MFKLLQLVGLFIAGSLAGAINSVAGGGSLISFPSLLAFGIPAIPANATNTMAVWPGSLSSAIAYSRDVKADRRLLVTLLLPSMVGALLGAVALVITPPALFNRVVPVLVLFATVLFASRGLIDRLVRRDDGQEHVSTLGHVWGAVFQLFVATYGGYFGAGIGIMMLGSLSIMGLRDIHKMNALKTILGTLINVIASVYFAARQLVVWPIAIVMGLGTIGGGWVGARLARRVDQRILRVFVTTVGLAVSVWLFLK